MRKYPVDISSEWEDSRPAEVHQTAVSVLIAFPAQWEIGTLNWGY
ncbi:hypothetical protein ACFOSV_05265 [Algoriphagus namhaensis]|uniref:Uncharacterized protein n=1 Tax=Algoriphagus namhaensis TaxID=915353 RepID=A0ABV8ARE2_9BACT